MNEDKATTIQTTTEPATKIVHTPKPEVKPGVAKAAERAKSQAVKTSMTHDPELGTGPAAPYGLEFEVSDLDLYYGDFQALKKVKLDIPTRQVSAFIGPSGCGKSTLLRCFNRMNDLVEDARIEGQILKEGQDIYAPGTDVVRLRKEVAMVFKNPNPFPISVYDNVAYGLRAQGIKNKSVLNDVVERSLREAALWDEVKDHLGRNAMKLSGGQQQRLCIARAIALEPEVILMDEPTSALDPIATTRIEDLMYELKQQYTIIIVTHSMSQAARISDRTSFFYLGELIEEGPTKQIFSNPQKQQTENYITGRFG